MLRRSNYERSVKGFNYLYEAPFGLQLNEFFSEERITKYENQIISLKRLRENFLENNIVEAKLVLNPFTEHCTEMMSDFQDFVKEGCENSQLFATGIMF